MTLQSRHYAHITGEEPEAQRLSTLPKVTQWEIELELKYPSPSFPNVHFCLFWVSTLLKLCQVFSKYLLIIPFLFICFFLGDEEKYSKHLRKHRPCMILWLLHQQWLNTLTLQFCVWPSALRFHTSLILSRKRVVSVGLLKCGFQNSF